MHIQVWFCDGICVRVGVLVKVAKKSKILKIKGCGDGFMGFWGFRGAYKGGCGLIGVSILRICDR